MKCVSSCSLEYVLDRQFLAKNPIEILTHAAKHGHPKLIKEVAPHLARLPIIKVVEQLPSRYVIPWVGASSVALKSDRN